MYSRDSIHWQEVASRWIDSLLEKMKNIYEPMCEAKSGSEQKYSEIQSYIQEKKLSKETAAEDSQYLNLVHEYNKLQESYHILSNQYRKWLLVVDDISRNIPNEMKTIFQGILGSDFDNSYQSYITEVQGKSVKDFEGVCGIIETCNIVNQQTRSNLNELDGIKEYREKGWCVINSDPIDNGGTTSNDRQKFLESKGLTFERLEGSVMGVGFTLEEIAKRFLNGESAGLILKAQDLEQPELSNRNKIVEFREAIKQSRRFEDPMYANHATTIAGFSYNLKGSIVGVWINDTGGGTGSNRVFIDKHKFMQMQHQTKGFAIEFSRKG